MTNEEILNKLKMILGSLYDLEKEDMYLRVVRIVEEESRSLIQEPGIPKVVTLDPETFSQRTFCSPTYSSVFFSR